MDDPNSWSAVSPDWLRSDLPCWGEPGQRQLRARPIPRSALPRSVRCHVDNTAWSETIRFVETSDSWQAVRRPSPAVLREAPRERLDIAAWEPMAGS